MFFYVTVRFAVLSVPLKCLLEAGLTQLQVAFSKESDEISCEPRLLCALI